VLKENKIYQPRILFSEKLYFKCQEEIKTFQNQQKLKEFVTRQSLEEPLERELQFEMRGH
jgi:hypothetical protein